MISPEKTKKFIKIAFPFLFFFCVFLIFYTKFYPLYIYDTNDWRYIAAFRHAVPIPFGWNPTRVLPETIMPLVSRISAFCIMPFNGGDLVQALADGFAIFFSIVISIYFCMFMNFFYRKFYLKYCYSLVISLLILFLHFWPFLHYYRACDNQFMFLTFDSCNMFFYVLPFLTTTIFVIMLATYDGSIKKFDNRKLLRTGFFLLMAYLVINSNMLQSIVLAAFLSSSLLLEFIIFLRNKNLRKIDLFTRLKQFCARNYCDLILLTGWLVSIIIEATGGRAGCYSGFSIKHSVGYFLKTLRRMNRGFFLVAFSSIFLGLGVFLVKRRKKIYIYDILNSDLNQANTDLYFTHMSVKLLFASFFSLVYLILLGARIGGWYLTEADVVCSWLIWIIWLAGISWAYIASKKNIAFTLLPLITYIVFFESVMCPAKFKYCNLGSNSSCKVVKAQSKNIVNQVLRTDTEGKKSVKILVPSYPNSHLKNNWPFNLRGGKFISDALFNFGLSREWIEVDLVPDQRINKKFNIKESIW